MHFRTGGLYQAYLAGLETGGSVPLERLINTLRWKQGRLLA